MMQRSKAVFEAHSAEEYGFSITKLQNLPMQGIGAPFERPMPFEAGPKGSMVQRNAG